HVAESREVLERLVERPRLVHVHLQRDAARDRLDCAHALRVEAVAAAQLELQALEAAAYALRAARHVVGIAEPDRPRGRRGGARGAPRPESIARTRAGASTRSHGTAARTSRARGRTACASRARPSATMRPAATRADACAGARQAAASGAGPRAGTPSQPRRGR